MTAATRVVDLVQERALRRLYRILRVADLLHAIVRRNAR